MSGVHVDLCLMDHSKQLIIPRSDSNMRALTAGMNTMTLATTRSATNSSA